MVKLETKTKKDVILMKDLKDGQLAVVLYDKDKPHYEGTVVQRYKDSAVAIGQCWGEGWTGIENNTLKVRLLKDGEILTIFDNK